MLEIIGCVLVLAVVLTVCLGSAWALPRNGPQPIRLQWDAFRGFRCRLARSQIFGQDTVLQCTPHALILRTPPGIGAREQRIPLGDISACVARKSPTGLDLIVVHRTGRIAIDAAGHPPGALAHLAELVANTARGAHPHEPPPPGLLTDLSRAGLTGEAHAGRRPP